MIELLKRHRLWQAAAVLTMLFTLYWGLLAANRYVSELHVVVESLQGGAATPTDLTALLGGSSSQQKDILMLRDYLLSADMLRVLDAKLDLREHYSGSYDVFSRLWSKNISAEWFRRPIKLCHQAGSIPSTWPAPPQPSERFQTSAICSAVTPFSVISFLAKPP